MSLRNRFSLPVLQFSPPRTGSTLVWNVLRELFPGRRIKKKHSLKKTRLGPFCLPIVCTVRHPLDAMASSIQCQELPKTDESIDMLRKEFDLAMRSVLDIRTDSHALILKYEQFSNDHEYLFNELECFFGINIDSHKRQGICDKYNVKKVKEKTEQMGDFDNWNKKDHFHGRHVSKFNGASGYYREFFTQEQICRLKAHYQLYLDAFGYTVDAQE